MNKNIERPQWFFAWSTGRPYITTMCGWTRKQVIRDAEKHMSIPWKRIYGQGGRALKCDIRVLD